MDQSAVEASRCLRLAHLYPNFMNLYGDRGNILCLKRRCASRQIDLVVVGLGPGDLFDADAYDLIFMGGGQDREQWRVADDLVEGKGPGLRAAVDRGVPTLTVCGGYQMMGRYYQSADGRRLMGLDLYDMVTVHPGERARRCIGNIQIAWDGGDVVGFENHGGRTFLGPDATPLGRVIAGHGNNGEDGLEGCRYKNAFGTYLHGSLLPKNPALADYLVGLALQRKYGHADLAPLDDALEMRAHAAAVAIAQADVLKHSLVASGRGIWGSVQRLKRAASRVALRQP